MGEKPLKKKKLLENSCDLACQMHLIIRIFSSISREFRDIQWDLLFCLENTLPIVGTRRGKKLK